MLSSFRWTPRVVEPDTETTADDLACMALICMEREYEQLSRIAADLPVNRIREIIDLGKRLSALAEDALNESV